MGRDVYLPDTMLICCLRCPDAFLTASINPANWHTGDVPQYEKQAWQAEASGIVQPSLLQLTPLPEHLNDEPQRSSHEGVMNWLHDGPAVQHTDSFGREASQSDAGARTPISPSG